MGSLAPELELDLKLFTKKTIGCFLKNEMNLKDFVCLLEEERSKIEAFKRELPLCMILVNDVIHELKLEVEQCQNGDCVIEEFISLKARSDEHKEQQEEVKLEKNSKEKMDWMSSAQLWNDNCSDESDKKNGDGVGAFVPWKVIPVRKEEEKLSISLPDPGPAIAGDNRISESELSTSAGNAYLVLQAQRKARRCWSPELHRRFVVALQQLGGAQVATPKQIRELMMVNGLTNDEVKSHLQKYRLHTRRVPNCSASQVNRPVVMSASLWVSQNHSASQFGSPQQFACTAQAFSRTGGDSFDDDGKSESYITK